MNKDYIVVSGYICSGSFVICDLLKEVRGIGTLKKGGEFKLVKEPYGLISLQNGFKNDGWSWWKCNEHIKQFIRFYHMLCNPKHNSYDYFQYINEYFIKYSDEFVENLVDFEFEPGSSISDLLDKFYDANNNIIVRIINRITGVSNRQLRCYFSSCTEEKFIELVQEYIEKLFSGKMWDGYNRICLAQALHPLDGIYLHDYFPNAKMIVVSRNPLDQLASLIENSKGIGVEMKKNPDAEKYIAWFMRQKRNLPNNKDILYVKYEEMIVQYENKIKDVFDFCGINPKDHIHPQQYFDPEISITRIGKWKKYLDIPQYSGLFKKLKTAMDEGRLS